MEDNSEQTFTIVIDRQSLTITQVDQFMYTVEVDDILLGSVVYRHDADPSGWSSSSNIRSSLVTQIGLRIASRNSLSFGTDT